MAFVLSVPGTATICTHLRPRGGLSFPVFFNHRTQYQVNFYTLDLRIAVDSIDDLMTDWLDTIRLLEKIDIALFLGPIK